jgi:hypothetical protein
MERQKKLVDRVVGVSKETEAPAGREERLPERLTVRFRAGSAGLLDMTNPRAAHWQSRIAAAQGKNEPVYVEIDDETRVITNVRIPRRYRVERIGADEHGNLRVQLRGSQAVRVLLRSAPNFHAMRAHLEAAAADGSERLVTDTRDEHEIIDVRTPETDSEEPSEPAPPAPDDPPVSPARAAELFELMAGESCSPANPSSTCIPFLYPDDGCWVRAHIMCHLMRDGTPAEDPEKVWISGSLDAPTANHPDCRVLWSWHVAPTLMVTLTSGNEKRVIDPSLLPSPESISSWKGRQGDPGATLQETSWTAYNFAGDTTAVTLAQAHAAMQYYRDELRDRTLDLGTPPYSCTKRCFFIVDRSTFSDVEVEAMLALATPAIVQDAFYVVVDGFSPYDLGITTPTMSVTPTLSVSPTLAGVAFTATRLEFEYPTHLNRRQRLTWVYRISFANTSAFTAENVPVVLLATVSTVFATASLLLIRQPNPYEIDGATSWLSTDLRVFQIRANQSKFGVTMGSDASAFITQALQNLNAGTTGGQTFENDISTDQQASRLELSTAVNGTAVYNFAVAKVRYRALTTSATDVRVFFRLFPVATTSLEFNLATTYRRSTSSPIPLLGVAGGNIVSIPCFATPRVDSSTSSLATQTDLPNVATIPPNASGNEVVRYFGCWLDFNQTEPQFPLHPASAEGPFSSGRLSIQDHIRNQHQCLVSEIAFAPAPAQNGSTPGTSDKLAQRNLAIVPAANPGVEASRRVPQTFEIQPSGAKVDHDELMIEWGDVPAGSIATVYLPGIDANALMRLSAEKYRSHRLTRIDEHTVKFDTGGITYLPIPFVSTSLPGMLSVDLPAGIVKGQAFKVVVRQVTAGQRRDRPVTHDLEVEGDDPTVGPRRIVGSFQLTIPVSTKADMLPDEVRLLSTLRWIERAIPAGDRWRPVFLKYVDQVAARVDALGGDSPKVAPSPAGDWQRATTHCLLLGGAAAALLGGVLFVAGTQPLPVVVVVGVPAAGALAGVVHLWQKTCRPTPCQMLKAALAGSALGAVGLTAVVLTIRPVTKRLVASLVVSTGIAGATAIQGWAKGCFR